MYYKVSLFFLLFLILRPLIEIFNIVVLQSFFIFSFSYFKATNRNFYYFCIIKLIYFLLILMEIILMPLMDVIDSCNVKNFSPTFLGHFSPRNFKGNAILCTPFRRLILLPLLFSLIFVLNVSFRASRLSIFSIFMVWRGRGETRG